jgi:surface antigen
VRKLLSTLIFPAIAVGLAGCMGAGEQPQPAAPAPKANPVLAGVVSGPTGTALTQEDRLTAGRAQYQSIVEGKRRSWRGKAGSFGYIVPGPVSAGIKGNCREYSHTIYLNGRPQTGKGSACQTAPGQWSIVS